jgi:hypothetical protein
MRIEANEMHLLHSYFHFVIEIVMHNMWRIYATLDPYIQPDGKTLLEPPRRLIFTKCKKDGWRDPAGLNAFFLRTAFPGMSIETEEDWNERAGIGSGGHSSTEAFGLGGYPATARAIIMDRVVLVDRPAWMREPHAFKNPKYVLPYVESYHYWAPLRQGIVEYAAGEREIRWPGERELRLLAKGYTPSKQEGERPVITYISRQRTARRLRDSHHQALVQTMQALAKEHDYEFMVPVMEEMNKFDQIYLLSQTTVSHLMEPNLLFACGNNKSYQFVPCDRYS